MDRLLLEVNNTECKGGVNVLDCCGQFALSMVDISHGFWLATYTPHNHVYDTSVTAFNTKDFPQIIMLFEVLCIAA